VRDCRRFAILRAKASGRLTGLATGNKLSLARRCSHCAKPLALSSDANMEAEHRCDNGAHDHCNHCTRTPRHTDPQPHPRGPLPVPLPTMRLASLIAAGQSASACLSADAHAQRPGADISFLSVRVCAVLLCVLPVMAADCSVNSPTASSPCCTFMTPVNSAGYHLFDFYAQGWLDAALCTVRDPLNTVEAQQNQAALDSYTSFWDTNECWGGHIAKAPGDRIETLPIRQDFARLVSVAKCEVHFRVDGAWTTWTSWSACQVGNSTRSRSCSNPAPAMGGANCTGAATEQQPCALSSSTASATDANDQGAFGSAPSEGSQARLIGAAFSASSTSLLNTALPLLALLLLFSA
jgi:hypothetical protein